MIKCFIKKWSNDFQKRLYSRNHQVPKNDEYYFSAYLPLLKYVQSTNDKSVFGWVMMLDKEIHGLMIFGKISDNSCSQYVGISNTWDNQFKNIATTMIIVCMVKLYEKSIQYINRGGTEYEGLFRFNQKFNPILKQVDYLKFG